MVGCVGATEKFASFDDPAVVDRVLREYLRRSDHTAWSPYQFFSGGADPLDPEALSDTEALAYAELEEAPAPA